MHQLQLALALHLVPSRAALPEMMTVQVVVIVLATMTAVTEVSSHGNVVLPVALHPGSAVKTEVLPETHLLVLLLLEALLLGSKVLPPDLVEALQPPGPNKPITNHHIMVHILTLLQILGVLLLLHPHRCLTQ